MIPEKDSTPVAARYNEGKPKFSLLDFDALEDTVRVLEFGAKKYSRDGWKIGHPPSEIIDSLIRHLQGMQRGEYLDPESGLPHHGHIGCNAIFLAHSLTQHPELDDMNLVLSIKE